MSTMEEVISRFPHLGVKIFNSLENKSIFSSMKVCRFWNDCLKSQKFVQIRKMKATVGQFHKIGKSWKTVFDTASSGTIMELAKAVDQFYQKDTDLEYYECLTPLHQWRR